MTEQITTGRANQKLRTYNAIVQAAAELSRTGREVTMLEIAKAALVSEATAYRYFPDLASLLREAIAEQLPNPAAALEPVAATITRSADAATITRSADAAARPGLRFGLIDHALAPMADTRGAADPGSSNSAATSRSWSAPRSCST